MLLGWRRGWRFGGEIKMHWHNRCLRAFFWDGCGFNFSWSPNTVSPKKESSFMIAKYHPWPLQIDPAHSCHAFLFASWYFDCNCYLWILTWTSWSCSETAADSCLGWAWCHFPAHDSLYKTVLYYWWRGGAMVDERSSGVTISRWLDANPTSFSRIAVAHMSVPAVNF